MKHLLEVDSILYEVDKKVLLQDIYLQSETGTITGMLGLNGTGKSSLLKIIFGMLNCSNKSIRIDGKGLFNTSRNPETMRYLPQVHFIPPFLTVKQVFNDFECSFSAFIHHFPNFEQHYHQRFKSLSGGEKRIIETYLILTAKTRFCLLDEPFSQLMPIHVETVKQIIHTEKTKKGILLTDHSYEDVLDVSDHLYLLANSSLTLVNSIEDLIAKGYIPS